jgi:hypothetical protein
MNIGQFALKGKPERDRCRKNIARRPIEKYGDILRFRVGKVSPRGAKPYPLEYLLPDGPLKWSVL